MREEATCPVCGRPTVRHGISYELGRRGSAAYRMWDRWRHQDDNTIGCGQDWGDRTQEFPDTM